MKDAGAMRCRFVAHRPNSGVGTGDVRRAPKGGSTSRLMARPPAQPTRCSVGLCTRYRHPAPQVVARAITWHRFAGRLRAAMTARSPVASRFQTSRGRRGRGPVGDWSGPRPTAPMGRPSGRVHAQTQQRLCPVRAASRAQPNAQATAANRRRVSRVGAGPGFRPLVAWATVRQTNDS